MDPASPRHGPRSFQVGSADAGSRLDVYLAAALGVSRAEARRLLARGGVSLDGRPVSLAAKGARVEPGAQVEVAEFTPPLERRPTPAAELPLVVLASGPGWLVVDKPAGVPVHPFAQDETRTLLNALVARYPEVVGVGEGALRSGVVHRLDVDTSGALVFATRQPEWLRLREAFRRHRVEKLYRALVVGELRGEGELNLDLVVACHRPARVRVAAGAAEEQRARRTRLHWRSVESLQGATLVEVSPRTGFLHQIRGSLAHLGHPVVGDPVYGEAQGAPRQMLHAARVAIGEVRASSPDPPDFLRCLESLREAPGLSPAPSPGAGLV